MYYSHSRPMLSADEEDPSAYQEGNGARVLAEKN